MVKTENEKMIQRSFFSVQAEIHEMKMKGDKVVNEKVGEFVVEGKPSNDEIVRRFKRSNKDFKKSNLLIAKREILTETYQIKTSDFLKYATKIESEEKSWVKN